ncbi:MAG TPA: discoidin domain-containing protein, partial [Vicinamibacteria bacterium]|nr:discoidin domain-containing protein [Vicinamibacteria bacterium]
QDTLFPGLVTLVLGLSGLAAAPRRYRAVALAASAAAVVISLGPQTGVYRFLHEHLVFVRGVRALSRFSLLPVLVLSVLSGFALAGRRRLALPALALFLVESTNAPIRYHFYSGPPEADRFLAGRPGAVARLPLGEGDTAAMLFGVAHWRPLVNGDSGFVPRPYSRAMELLEGPLTPEGLRFLRAAGVTQVVSADELPLREVARFGEERVFDVPAGDTAQVVQDADPSPTLWTLAGPVVDLGERREVARVVFEVTDRPWVAEPDVSVSDDGRAWVKLPARASLADATLSLYRDPRRGRGEVRFGPVTARFVRLGPGLPLRPSALEAGS